MTKRPQSHSIFGVLELKLNYAVYILIQKVNREVDRVTNECAS